MAMNPLPIIAIITATLVFQALIFGEEYAEQSFPNYEEFTSACDDGDDGFFSGIYCIFQQVGYFFRVIVGVVLFLFNLISFNVPGAPWFIRVIVSGILGGGIFWATATLFRGN
jgi:hypothetical protein